VLKTYTAFCQERGNSGTIWISSVEAENLDDAIELAAENCAYDWSYPVDEVHVLGVAQGDVSILHWEDQD
jgi:hypothetical protein